MLEPRNLKLCEGSHSSGPCDHRVHENSTEVWCHVSLVTCSLCVPLSCSHDQDTVALTPSAHSPSIWWLLVHLQGKLCLVLAWESGPHPCCCLGLATEIAGGQNSSNWGSEGSVAVSSTKAIAAADSPPSPAEFSKIHPQVQACSQPSWLPARGCVASLALWTSVSLPSSALPSPMPLAFWNPRMCLVVLSQRFLSSWNEPSLYHFVLWTWSHAQWHRFSLCTFFLEHYGDFPTLLKMLYCSLRVM